MRLVNIYMMKDEGIGTEFLGVYDFLDLHF